MINKEQRFQKYEEVADLIEKVAAYLRGEIPLDPNKQKWAAVYLQQGADYIRRKVDFEREVIIRYKLMKEIANKEQTNDAS